MGVIAELARAAGSAVERWQVVLLALLMAAAGAVWAFIELLDEVVEGETREIDRRILLALRNPADIDDPLGPHWVEELGRDVTALGGVGVLVLLVAGAWGYLMLRGQRRAALLLLIGVGVGQILSLVLKQGVDRPRPELVPHESFVYTASFPSGHSLMAAVTYLTLGAMLARVESRPAVKLYIVAAAMFVTLIVGVSRIYLGVHWPTDVIAGWAVGAAWALLWWAVVLYLQRSKRVESAVEDR